MAQHKREEEPIEAVSLSGLWRSSYALMYAYQGREPPNFTFCLAFALWGAGICRMVWPEMVDPVQGGYCLFADSVFAPASAEWRRYLLHALWPLGSSYFHAILTSAALLLAGNAYEYEKGTVQFATLFVGLHVACSIVLLYFGFAACHVSMQATFAAVAVVMHRENPVVFTNGYDKAIDCPWPVEARWHLWIVLSVLLLFSQDFATSLCYYGVGLSVGAFVALRDPELWQQTFNVIRTKSPGIGRLLHIGLFFFMILFMPLTTTGPTQPVIGALQDGSALSLQWWKANVPSSPALLHLALAGLLGPQALWLLQLLVSFAVPLLFSPLRRWTRGYSVGCVILMMYSMNSPAWKYPHVGFLTMGYLAWAFWVLPNVHPVGYKLD